ncbi:hypothetical protein [Ferdinandcohnia sp. Marseille-Q9671]
MENHVEELNEIIRRLRNTSSKERAKKLELDKCERLVQKMDSFSEKCVECREHLLVLKNQFRQLEENIEEKDSNSKQHKKVINDIVSHLQKKHKLVQEGTYLAIYMSIGMSLGMVFGFSLSDNFALWMPIGMSLGIAVGAGLDADAKKKGKTI